MGLEDFIDMTNIELNLMTLILTSKAQRAALTIGEFIDLAQEQGADLETIRAYLLKDLEGNGKLFGQFRNSIRSTATGVINRMADSAQWAEDTTVSYRWVAVLVNTCPDCIKRHGDVKTMEEWEVEGLPRAGLTICGEHCKCKLIDADSSILEPIKRSRK